LGYQIADQLAVQLPVRERMQQFGFNRDGSGRIGDGRTGRRSRHRDASPYLIWEWLVVEARCGK
jgi:hypothetical protein